MSYKLIVTIVPQYSGELITKAARDAGCPGGTVILGRGTSPNAVIQLLGLGESTKDITYNIVKEEDASKIIDSIEKVASTKKKGFGVLFSISVDEFLKAGENEGNLTEKGESKMQDAKFAVINVIVNRGYAEDAMAAARRAGAGGGTIINAHGTAREGDAKFFGAEIVPEKEMLMILVPTEKRQEIVNAISDLNCFKKAGSGIIFCNEANDFMTLGK